MYITAFLVFIALYFIKAGYGIPRMASRECPISNKLAWVLMEAPVFIVMFWLWDRSGVGFSVSVYLFFLLLQLRHFQRSFVLPSLSKRKSWMPVAIMAMGTVLSVLDGMMQAGGLFCSVPEGLYTGSWAHLLKLHALLGVLLLFAGMFINLHSDHVTRHLHKPDDTGHYSPVKSLYRYVTSVNYLGKLVEWTGFAVLAASPAVWVFVWWTLASPVPCSDTTYHHYRAEFGDETMGKCKRIIPYVY